VLIRNIEVEHENPLSVRFIEPDAEAGLLKKESACFSIQAF
jgi:hypothetical protein